MDLFEKCEKVKVPIESAGSYVAVIDGCLFCRPMLIDGGNDKDEWHEVSEPASQDFLDEVNEIFGTDFKYVDGGIE